MTKIRLFILSIFLILNSVSASAQEDYGRTFNLGVGIGGYSGYYGYLGRSTPIVHLNYELTVGRNFTLAPFVTIYSRTNKYYWGNPNKPAKYYSYRETVIPVGIKASYYFDEILGAGAAWDFYFGGSLGYAIINSRWEDGYDGDRYYYGQPSNLFVDLHLGVEYHLNTHVGLFLDLSNGVSTLGLAIH